MGKFELSVGMDPEFLNYFKRHYEMKQKGFLVPDLSGKGFNQRIVFVKKRLNLFEKAAFYISDFVLYLRGLRHGSQTDFFEDLDSQRE